MGILDLFRRKIKDPELCRLRDLLTIAYASGEMTAKERNTILEIAAKHNISSSKFHQMLEISPDSVQDAYPITKKEKDEYLHELVYLMEVNSKHTMRAVNYVEFIAKKLGYTPQDVHEMIEVVTSSPINNSPQKKPNQWHIKSIRDFTQDEINAVSQAVVVSSQYGNSVQFTMISGGMTYIPIEQNSASVAGEIVDITKAKLLTLEKTGEIDIYRVQI
ncbi:hypothetical protein [Bacteroides faecium]|uniref:TerB family tellurite resistance protein n=1 Tax=Bacteroides faecium TaxID=2715212 RepID=A0A6H0KSF6_9BACE|nr:hypothetical protein [Bacteroides faecium]QIU96225.1 hypothetical protein BacF7301_19660 [Bacteroides faecium]